MIHTIPSLKESKWKMLVAGLLLAPLAFAGEVVTAILSGTWVHQKLLRLRAMAHIWSHHRKYNDNFGKVRIDNVSIGSGLYAVTFLFNIALIVLCNQCSQQWEENEGIVARQFGTLNQLLTQKYGKPEFSDSNKAAPKLPDTTVELSQMVISRIMAQIIVRYIPNSRVASDTSNL